MLNHIVIMGRLTRDPELRRTGNGTAVASFSVAVERDFVSRDGGERKTDFIDCVAWTQTGEFISKYFTKGSMICVEGRLELRDWTDRDGNKRRSAEIRVSNAYFCGSKRDSESNGNNYSGNNYGGNGYGSQGGYSAPQAPSYGGYNAPAPSYGGYSAPAAAPASDFAMLEDDDAQLPF